MGAQIYYPVTRRYLPSVKTQTHFLTNIYLDYKRFITEVGNGNDSTFLSPFTCPKKKLDFGAEHPPWAFWKEEQVSES